MQQVLRMLESRDSVQVTELAEVFSVSEVTVRSDLTELARQGSSPVSGEGRPRREHDRLLPRSGTAYEA